MKKGNGFPKKKRENKIAKPTGYEDRGRALKIYFVTIQNMFDRIY